MTDEDNDTAILKDPLRDSERYHLPRDDGEPRCGVNYRHGEWTTVPIEDVPDDLPECGICPRASATIDDSEPSILRRARNGSPEDFGLEPLP